MSETIAILIVWWGTGQYSRFDVERFESMSECEAARIVLLDDLDAAGWLAPGASEARCREVRRQTD